MEGALLVHNIYCRRVRLEKLATFLLEQLLLVLSKVLNLLGLQSCTKGKGDAFTR